MTGHSEKSADIERKWFRRAIIGCLSILIGAASAIGGQSWGMGAIHRMATSSLDESLYPAELNRIAWICGPFIYGGLILAAAGVFLFFASFIRWLWALVERRHGSPPG